MMEGSKLTFNNELTCEADTFDNLRVPQDHTNFEYVLDQAAAACAVSPDDIEDVHGVTPTQEGLWTASTQMYGAYTYELVLEARSSAVENLKAAWRELVRSTPMLRSCLAVLGSTNQLVQVVLRENGNRLDEILENASKQSENSGLSRLILSFAPKSFASGGTFKATLRIHHALFDGWAMHLVLERLRAAYSGAQLEIPPNFRSFIEYIDEQKMTQGENGAYKFWRARLAGCSSTDIVDRIPGLEQWTDSTVSFTSERSLPRMRASAGSFTINTVVHAAWAMLAGAYAATDDVLFGTVISGRDTPVDGILDMVGPTMATIPSRIHVKQEQPLVEFLEEVSRDSQAAAPFHLVGLSKICGEICGIESSQIQSLLVCQPPCVDVAGFQSDTDVNPDWKFVDQVDNVHPYALVIESWLPRGVGPMRLTAHHDSRLFSSSQARILLEQLSDLIFKFSTSIEESSRSSPRVGDISLASAGDLQALRRLNAKYPPPVHRCIHDLFTDSVRQYSESIAVDAWDEKFTYTGVDELSNVLSQILVRRGVGPESRVLVFFPKSAWIVIATMAVLKAGGVFVPLEPAHPDGRLKDISRVSGADIAVVHPCLSSRFKGIAGSQIQIVDLDIEGLAHPPTEMRSHASGVADPSSLAYIIFTSGTTGVPKGVEVEHRAVCSSILARTGPDAMNMTSSSRVLQFSSYCFDAFIDELFMTLTCGACVCIPHADEVREDPSGVINRYQITWTFLTPSVARILNPKHVPSLQTLSMGGEPVLPADIEQWRGHISQLRGGYGPTECCVVCVVGDLFSKKRQTSRTSFIGTPRGCLAWVVDPSNPSRLSPFGAAGELLIEGPNLARGYLENTVATAYSWISNPGWPGGLGLGRRLYRTGDSVRMRPDGSLLYLGRIGDDCQVKLRGQRFELGEVEQHVRNVLPSIQQATAVIFNPTGAKDETTFRGETKTLALVFVSHGHTPPLTTGLLARDVSREQAIPRQLREELFELRQILGISLPSYMIPSYWVPLREMPLTPSTKADRLALARLLESLSQEELTLFSLEHASRTHKPATTNVEQLLVEIWSSLLGIDEAKISVDSNFPSLGGDSIKAMRLAALCRSKGLSGVSTAKILRLSTVEALAKETHLIEVEVTSDGELDTDPPVPFSLLSLVQASASGVVLDAAAACQVDSTAVQDVYPATPLQKGLFTLGVNNTHAYRGLFVYELPRDVDLDRLKTAWDALVEATPIIRTRLFKTSSDIFQAVVQDHVPCTLVRSSLEEHQDRERQASRLMSFGSSLYRASIVQDIQQGLDRRYFVLNAHHAVYDGWSVRGLMCQLMQMYQGKIKRDDSYSSRNPYARFVSHVLSGDLESQRCFWRDNLAGNPFNAFPEVKASVSKPQPWTDASTRHLFSFPRPQITPSVALYAAWSHLSSTYGGTDDVVFGIACTGRDIPNLPHSWDIVGPMVATLPLRVRLPTDRNVPMSAFLQTVQNAVAATTLHEHCGLREIRKASSDANTACGFHSLLIVQTTSKSTGLRDDRDELLETEMDLGANVHPYPLVLEATLLDSLHKINVTAHYDSDLMDEAAVQRLLEQLGHMVHEVVRLVESEGTIGQIDFLSPTDKAHIRDWNSDPTTVLPVERCVHDIVAERVLLHPDSPAVCAWDMILTYVELDHFATRLAEQLAKLGLKRADFVPICHEKSAWSVVAQLAVLKVGAACVSLDPSYPKARNDEIITQCRAQVVIVSSMTKSLFSGSPLTMAVTNSPSQFLMELTPPTSPAAKIDNTARPCDAAYCVFTSGSTGKPKGIIIEHGALCTSAQHYGTAMCLGPSSRVLQFASCAFDVSVGETLTTLMHGGCVCVPRDDDRLTDLAGCVRQFKVNWLYLTSSIASMLRPGDFQSLQTLVVGGEAVQQDLIETWAESGVTLINAYGPAETTIYCSARTVPTKDTDARDVGRPLGCRMWIACAQDCRKLAPIGATGEILIDGPILAREYLGRRDLTAAQFVTVPWLPGRRAYRTGDLACYDTLGNFHFRGRRDAQVKLNGQRVDLGEIESSLMSIRHDIQQVSAVLFERQVTANRRSHVSVQLAAFVVFTDTASHQGPANTASPVEMADDLRERILDIRKDMQRLVPRHMIPSIYLPMPGLPRTRTLKLDRKALRMMLEDMDEADIRSFTFSCTGWGLGNSTYQAPRNDMESTLLRHWSQALSLSEPIHQGIVGHFFDLGGDSISAMHFVWLARAEGLHLSVSDVYAHPTILELSEFLAAHDHDIQPSRDDQAPLPFSLVTLDEKDAVLKEAGHLGFAAEHVEDIYPATATQVGLLLQTEQHKDMWMARNCWEFPGGFDVGSFRAAWESVVERNPILRTRIVQAAVAGSSSQAYQIVLRHRLDFVVWDSASQQDSMGFGQPLSIHRLWDDKFEWIRHHAIYDGWSTKLLLHQLEHLYTNGYPATETVLPFATYIRIMQGFETQTARTFWQAELDGAEGSGALRAASFPSTLSNAALGYNASVPRTPAAGSRMKRQVPLPGVEAQGIATARLPVLIEAAWALTVSAYVGSEDILFGVVRSGRTSHPCLASVVGPTNCIVPRRFRMNGRENVGAFLEEASRRAKAATPYEYAGLDSMGEILAQGSSLLKNLLVVQTGTVISETGEAGQCHLDAIGLRPATEDDSPGASYPFGLVLECILPRSHSDQLQLLAYYDEHHVCEDTMQRMLSHFGHILTQLARPSPGTLLDDIGIWSPDLVQDQLPFVLDAPPPPSVESCAHELIAQHWDQNTAQAYAPAVCTAEGLSLTYRDLDRLSARLCRRLMRVMPIDEYRSPFVAVCFEKSPLTVVAMLAVWRAGRAVVLLDARQPQSCLRKIAHKAKATLVLVTPETQNSWQDPRGEAAEVMVVDSSELSMAVKDGEVIDLPKCLVKPDDPCYCVFTSGSTGEPKGVVVQHQAIVTSAMHHGRLTGLSTDSRVLQFSSYSFDVAVDEILTTLIYGGCVCVVSEEDSKACLAEAICEMNVNVVLLTPGVMETLNPAAVPCLKTAVVGGSSLSASLHKLWQDRVRLLVAYGPSECSVTATMNTNVSGAYLDSIGLPVGCRAWVLALTYDDDNGHSQCRPRLAPLGSVGELAIEGPILARGYLDDEELTSQKFILASSVAGGFCKFTGCSPHARLYRTGDAVKQMSEGSLVFMGRRDNQVKVRGVRVELEAIEHGIIHSESIAGSIRNVVVALPRQGPLLGRLVSVLQLRKDKRTSASCPGIQLVDGTQQPLVKVIKAHLQRHLPASHIPDVWAEVGHMPLLSSNKVDRKSIRHELEAISQDRCLPCLVDSPHLALESKSSMEMILRDLMGQVLGVDLSSTPSSATFPELGGNSLLAMHLVSKCKTAAVSISLGHLLGNHSISELARAATEQKMQTRPRPPGKTREWGRVKLTLAQRMFFSVYPFGPNYFNQSMFVTVNSASLSSEDLRGHLLKIIEHHPALRSRFLRRWDEASTLWQWECAITNDVLGSLRFRIHVLQPGQEAEDVLRITAETQQSLNLSAGPIFAADVFISPDGTTDLLLVSHHLVVDVVSWSVLLNDLEALLSGFELSPDTTHTLAQEPYGDTQENSPCDATTMYEIRDFWGLSDNTERVPGPKLIPSPTNLIVTLGSDHTCTLSAAIAAIDGLDLADVVEAALSEAFDEVCRNAGRKTGPSMFVEEHGRGNELASTVGWLTKLRMASSSASQESLLGRIWHARQRRLHSRSCQSTNMPSLPLELVLNYIGQTLVSKAGSGRILEHDSGRSISAMKVPDTDPCLEPLALIEVLASLGDHGLALKVTCDGRLQHMNRVRAGIDACMQILQVDAPSVLASLVSRQSLRRLPVIDTEDFSTSQQRRLQLVQYLALDDINDIQEVMACTPAQTRILLGQARDPCLYHIQTAWEVSTTDGCGLPNDTDKLQLACDRVVRHHAALRAHYVHLQDLEAPVQVVLRNPAARKVLQVRPASGCARSSQIELDVAHAAFDGASSALLLRDIGLAYCDKPLHTDSTTALRRYVEHIEQADMQAADKYWAQRLADVQHCCLPAMGFVDDGDESDFGSFDRILDGKFGAALITWCQNFSATPAVAIHIAWALTLGAYTGVQDVCFGWMTTGRDAPVPGIEDAIAMFANLVVCRANVAAENRLVDVAVAMVQELADGLEHQLGSPRLYQSGRALCDTLVSVQAIDGPGSEGGLVFRQLHGVDRTEFALFLNVGVGRGMIEFRVTYNKLKISGTAARAFFSAFEQALGSMLTLDGGTETTLANIALCSPLHRQLAHDFNAKSSHTINGALGPQLAHTIPSLFFGQVETLSDAIAVESWDARFTFTELDNLSAGLCLHLLRLGLVRGDTVPLLCDKSAWVVVSMLAILRVGASCAFLSPSDGVHRLRNIIVDQIGAKIVMVSPKHMEKTRTLGCHHVVVLDPALSFLQNLVHDVRAQSLVDDSHPEDVAFVVFTSGSTGKPKGVMLPHSSLCFSVLNYSRSLHISEHSRIFQFSAYTFDVGIGDMVAALVNGATLCVPSEHDRTSDLNGAIERTKSNWLMTTPSVANLLMPDKCANLRSLALIGEAPNAKLYNTWHGRLKLFNTWGPAECAVLSSVQEIQSQGDNPNLIGDPTSCRLWLVSPSEPSRLVPTGCVGEILVEGPNVAYGYLNDQERTRQVFIPAERAPSALQPSIPHARFYLTGDCARYVPHQGLLLVGRKDSQIKLRGQRVELGEIESHVCHRVQEAIQKLGLRSHGVFAAVDVFQQRTGESALAAFLLVCPEKEVVGPVEVRELSDLLGVTIDEPSFHEQVKRQLCNDLATYMVPLVFIPLSALPKSPSGKLDRKVLRALAQTHATAAELIKSPAKRVAAVLTDATQRLLRTLWSELLEVDETAIGSDSNFFRLGGDSILAMRLAAESSKQGLKLPVLTIMRFPELSGMAAQIRRDGMVPADDTTSDRFRLGGSCSHEFPATNFQTAIVHLNMAPARGFMNYFVLRLAPGTNQHRLEAACRALVSHHAVLRSSFVRRGSRVFQRISSDQDAVGMKRYKCTAREDLDVLTGNIIASDRAVPLQWGDCHTTMFFILQDGTGVSRLIIRISHALYDGMCLPVLWRDLIRAYAGQALEPARGSFAQFANAVANVSQDAVHFWKSLMRNSHITCVVREPRVERNLTSATGIMGGHASRVMSSDSLVLSSMTPASLLKAAWAVVLACISDSDDVVFGHIVSCRETLPLSMHETFGAFLNCIPVRVRLTPTSAQQLVQDVHQQHVAALPFNTVGLQQLIEFKCVKWPADVRFSSVVQYQNLPLSRTGGFHALDSGPLAETALEFMGTAGSYSDLWVTASPGGESTEVEIVFDEAVVPAELVEKLLEALCTVVCNIHEDQKVAITTLLGVSESIIGI